ncbi:hypothetical protein [Streptomonospora salina]|uniref:Sugar lactone lactonase YvrE n=1 Tax=Streptomonospora salina TaxID=104205 RepID=A0A841EGW7_9ACTN|nr:hypothetical protein [Streptomonospora salina]MBB6000609.1 sugar lactone lactonase YvrE [Streptomonospora salina]
MPLGPLAARFGCGTGAAHTFALLRAGALALAALTLVPSCGTPPQAEMPGTIETVVGTGEPGWLEGGYGGDAGDANQARLNAPGALAFAADGTLYIADTDNNRIRSVNPDSGTVNTVAGGGATDWARAECATAAALPDIAGLAVSSYGDTLYAASTLQNQVVAIDPHECTIELTAGRADGSAVQLSEHETGELDGLWWPKDVAVGPDGTLYIGDSGNDRVVAVGPHEARSSGRPDSEYVRVVAGNGAPGRSGATTPADTGIGDLGRLDVDGEGSVFFVDGSAGLRKVDSYKNTVTADWNPRLPEDPQAIAVNPRTGRLFATDTARNLVMAYAPGSREPTVVAGTGSRGFTGDGGPADEADLDSPGGLAVSPGGDLYIADTHNHRIRMVHDVDTALDDRTG